MRKPAAANRGGYLLSNPRRERHTAGLNLQAQS